MFKDERRGGKKVSMVLLVHADGRIAQTEAPANTRYIRIPISVEHIDLYKPVALSDVAPKVEWKEFEYQGAESSVQFGGLVRVYKEKIKSGL